MYIDLSSFPIANKTVAIALSGGGDSMALLHYMLSQTKIYHFSLIAINIEHGIRGESSISDTKFVIVAHLYGLCADMDEIIRICREHNAVIIEDAAESLGATYKGVQTGSFGAYNCISFNGNKIITGSSGGMLLTDCEV